MRAFPLPRRKLEQTLTSERSAYLNARINAAVGFCPEPKHPLDPPEQKPDQRRFGASHRYKLGLTSRKDYIR